MDTIEQYPEQYQGPLSTAIERFHHYMNLPESEWKHKLSGDRVDLYTVVKDDNLSSVKTSKIVGYTDAHDPETAANLSFNQDFESKKAADPQMKAEEVLEVLSDDCCVVYSAVNSGVSMVNARDIVFLKMRCQDEEGFYHILISVEHEDKPPAKGMFAKTTRGTVLIGGCKFSEEGGRTKMEMLSRFDPNGSIPSFAVNLAVEKTAHSLTKLINYIESQ
eukprot:TRINITY_DN675_c0_g1_i1.p1 TRINITY_DN675_c0_g1~~TRINITY_DN675_c0_g1_i1.p1  ORF type:complete len:227 (+),score=49.46 TRINITY_DN675_c0_g1_i1:27-683(+)